jgi:hypothetical protein
MNTLINTSTLLVILTLFLVVSTSTFNIIEESYINNSSFNTVEVYNESVIDQQIQEFDFKDEKYINDIEL